MTSKVILVSLSLVFLSGAMAAQKDARKNNPMNLKNLSCGDDLCSGKVDGNYKYLDKPNYFVQCVDGIAHCLACWPKTLVFSQECNQCLYTLEDECVTTKTWKKADDQQKMECPDMCPKMGHKYKGNLAIPDQSSRYCACWNGVTIGCIKCPAGLMFNEEKNACLWEGKYMTIPM